MIEVPLLSTLQACANGGVLVKRPGTLLSFMTAPMQFGDSRRHSINGIAARVRPRFLWAPSEADHQTLDVICDRIEALGAVRPSLKMDELWGDYIDPHRDDPVVKALCRTLTSVPDAWLPFFVDTRTKAIDYLFVEEISVLRKNVAQALNNGSVKFADLRPKGMTWLMEGNILRLDVKDYAATLPPYELHFTLLLDEGR